MPHPLFDRYIPRLAFIVALVTLAGACATGPSGRMAPGVEAREAGAFVVRLGSDTLAVERFTRTPGQVEGSVLARSPKTNVQEYTGSYGANGGVTNFTLASRAAADTAAPTRATVAVRGDSVRVSMERGARVQDTTLVVQAPVLPWIGNSYALFEPAFVQLRASGADTLRMALLPVGGRRAVPVTFTRLGSDSVAIELFSGRSVARVDDEGRLLAWDGRGSTMQVRVEREAAVDLERLTAEYTAAERRGRTLGTLSPRDSVQVETAGATLRIDYGRPRARGREIFGGVVPWNEVWRTGANAATGFSTSRDLELGGVMVPEGSYTLFTLPTPDGWQLIVNRQTGQWGTEYDPARDLARIPMRVERTRQPVEAFTISVDPNGNGGVLALEWADTRATVDFIVR